MNEKGKQPLVSIIIVTYNSSRFVTETLDSAITQTYPNIEIIITDDCSTDDTVQLCREWILNHKGSEKRLQLITVEKNTGIAGNANRGAAAAKGDWLKFIAGDDILASTAIENYMDYIGTQPGVLHMIAGLIPFSGDFKYADLNKPEKVIAAYLYQDEVTAEEQFKVITKMFFGSGPTYFINANALRECGGFDERFPMQEDYPLFIKMIGKGYKMMYMEKITVYYRELPTSLSHNKSDCAIFSNNAVRMIRDWRYEYKMEQLNAIWRMFLRYSLCLQNAIIKNGNSYMSLKCRVLNFIDKVTDPFLWYGRRIDYKNKMLLFKKADRAAT